MTIEPRRPERPSLERLALARSTLDRAAERRADPDLLPRLLEDEGTAVLLLVDGAAPVVETSAGPRLVLVRPAQVPGDGHLLFLGLDQHDRGFLAHSSGSAARGAAAAVPDLPPPAEAPEGTRWAGLRDVGTVLDDRDAGLLTGAVALGAWHAAHPHCSRCGAPTDVVQAGWSRRCPVCGAEHYPRTDPAVIMAVVDAEDRLLLGRQATWPALRYSTLAGFVEPGESLEDAVRREVLEEAGVEVGSVHYRGSQPWPFPSSLMLGFRAEARSVRVRVDGVELADARWWDRAALAADVAEGRLLLPPPVSIARHLIEEWFGGPIDAVDAWR